MKSNSRKWTNWTDNSNVWLLFCYPSVFSKPMILWICNKPSARRSCTPRGWYIHYCAGLPYSLWDIVLNIMMQRNVVNVCPFSSRLKLLIITEKKNMWMCWIKLCMLHLCLHLHIQALHTTHNSCFFLRKSRFYFWTPSKPLKWESAICCRSIILWTYNLYLPEWLKMCALNVLCERAEWESLTLLAYIYIPKTWIFASAIIIYHLFEMWVLLLGQVKKESSFSSGFFESSDEGGSYYLLFYFWYFSIRWILLNLNRISPK